jgi:hypothetical protein
VLTTQVPDIEVQVSALNINRSAADSWSYTIHIEHIASQIKCPEQVSTEKTIAIDLLPQRQLY